MLAECTYWAEVGECDREPTFMFVNCGPSCLACDEIYNAKSKDYGVWQVTDEEASLDYLIKVDKYMNEEVFKDEKYAKVIDLCKNKHDLCTFWAEQGDCEMEMEFTLEECAPACFACDEMIKWQWVIDVPP
jgi:hypothetical protein